jgi:hypothetical protein
MLADCMTFGTDNAGVTANGTTVSLQRCQLAGSTGVGLFAANTSKARVEGCKFVRNGNDTLLLWDTALYTDMASSNFSQGCSACQDIVYGRVLRLEEAPANIFLTGADAGFVQAQQVTLCPVLGLECSILRITAMLTALFTQGKLSM